MIKKGTKLQRYDWDGWLLKKRGEQTVIVKGRDFKCQTYAMTIQIRTAAAKRDRTVSLHTEEANGGSVIVVTITGRKRSISDVIGRSSFFANMTAQDRNQCTKYAQSACKLFKSRAGADINAFCPKWSNADYLDLLDCHPRILRCVKHVYIENGKKNRIGQYLSPGYAAGFLYLMGCSASDGDKYRDNPCEDSLDWSRWDKACDFFVLIAGNSKGLVGYRDTWAAMVEDNRISNADRWALLVTAWNLYVEGKKTTTKALNLEHDTDNETLRHTPTVGGIDLGDPDQIEEEEAAADDP